MSHFVRSETEVKNGSSWRGTIIWSSRGQEKQISVNLNGSPLSQEGCLFANQNYFYKPNINDLFNHVFFLILYSLFLLPYSFPTFKAWNFLRELNKSTFLELSGSLPIFFTFKKFTWTGTDKRIAFLLYEPRLFIWRVWNPTSWVLTTLQI